MIYGETKRLNYSPKTDGVSFTSDCEDIVSVTEKGRLNAASIGTAIVTGRNGDTEDKVTVEVKNKDLYGNVYYSNYWDSADLDIQSEGLFEELHIYGAPDDPLRVGRTFPVGAIPYPLSLYTEDENILNYCIDWSSSNPEIAEVKYGVIEPLSPGKVTITATIHGTDISDSLDIEVIAFPQREENFMHITEDYEYEGHKLTGGTSSDCTYAIYGAITEAKASGYNGVKFDKMELHTAPVQLIGLSIPSDFVVDFGFSSIYMDAWHDYVNGTIADGTKGKAYRYFMGTDSENSVIRNLYYYGETYDGSHQNAEYGEQTLFFAYDNARYLDIYNVFFESVIGFNVAAGYMLDLYDRDYHLGNPDGRSNGDIDYTNLLVGRMLSDGSVDTEQTDWIYTPAIIPFNNQYYSPYHYIGTNYTPELGQVFSRTRFYNIAFYDAENNIIEFGSWRNAFAAYKTPENAVGYRITFPNGGILPESNSSIRGDSFVQRMMPANPTYCCAMYNCTCGNNFSGILSVTGSTKNFFFYNNRVTKNGTVNAWSYDIEDSWYSGQNCVTKNNSLPQTIAIAGVLNAIIDNAYINSLYLRRAESTVVLNTPLNYISYTEDINGVLGKSEIIATKTKNESYRNFGNMNFLEG